jgi:hypothetical protein
MKMWRIVGVETQLEWPAEETTVAFMGHTLVLRPPEGASAADIRVQFEDAQSERKALETIFRFLTALSWWHHCPARVGLAPACTAPTLRVGKVGFGAALRKDYRLSQGVRLPSESKARLALALYREALSVKGTPYEFLGYFKIISVRYKGDQIIRWINNAIPLLTDKRAKDRVLKLQATEADIGKYLYVSGRCAVAHASSDPVVDPDNPDDVSRLIADMPVAQALAEYLIEAEFGIPWELSKPVRTEVGKDASNEPAGAN